MNQTPAVESWKQKISTDGHGSRHGGWNHPTGKADVSETCVHLNCYLEEFARPAQMILKRRGRQGQRRGEQKDFSESLRESLRGLCVESWLPRVGFGCAVLGPAVIERRFLGPKQSSTSVIVLPVKQRTDGWSPRQKWTPTKENQTEPFPE